MSWSVYQSLQQCACIPGLHLCMRVLLLLVLSCFSLVLVRIEH
jgi:hypothetical protein